MKYATLVTEKAREFITPENYVWPGVPYSTVSDGYMGGDQEKDHVIQPLKCALLAMSLWDYSMETGCSLSKQMAMKIGHILADRQKEDGSFPIRVNARTGEILADNSTNIVFAIELWERLENDLPDSFVDAKEKALRWMFNNPLTTYRWISNFEDVGTAHMNDGSLNYNNADALYTAMYLLKVRDRDPSYIEKAIEISDWVEEGFVFYANEYPLEAFDFPCPSVMEQAAHYFAIDSHLARFGFLQLALYQATGEEKYLQKTRAAAHSLTHYIRKDGASYTYPMERITGVGAVGSFWFGCAFYSLYFLMKADQALGSQHAINQD